MKITVIRVMINGEVGYLNNYYNYDITNDPLQAANFDGIEDMLQEVEALTTTKCQFDKPPEVVVFEMRPVEIHSRVLEGKI